MHWHWSILISCTQLARMDRRTRNASRPHHHHHHHHHFPTPLLPPERGDRPTKKGRGRPSDQQEGRETKKEKTQKTWKKGGEGRRGRGERKILFVCQCFSLLLFFFFFFLETSQTTGEGEEGRGAKQSLISFMSFIIFISFIFFFLSGAQNLILAFYSFSFTCFLSFFLLFFCSPPPLPSLFFPFFLVPHQASDPSVSVSRVSFGQNSAVAMFGERDTSGGTGSARRRRERRLRAYLRYARMSVAMALAESTHHSAPRCQKTARAGEEARVALHGHGPEAPLPQGRVLRHVVGHLPAPSLDVPVPQMVDQLLDIEHFFAGRLSKCPRSCLSMSLCARPCALRSWWNSWWKYRRPYPTLRYSGLWSSSLTFQLLVVVGFVEVLKVFSQDRVQQRRCFLSRSLTSQFLVAIFKVSSQAKVQQPLLLTLLMLQMRLV